MSKCVHNLIENSITLVVIKKYMKVAVAVHEKRGGKLKVPLVLMVREGLLWEAVPSKSRPLNKTTIVYT